jgi:crossover junction endodeoxyribonuclease RuvC
LIIIGIDPGSIKCGYALIQVVGNKPIYLESGVIKTPSAESLISRLKTIKTEFTKIFTRTQPDAVAMESLIYVKSPTSLIKLAHSRGIILSCFIDQHSDAFYEYAPNVIKSVATGHGHADKESIQKFLKLVFKVDQFKTDDESDALAVAYCHYLHLNHHLEIKKTPNKIPSRKRSGSSLAAAVAHALGDK